MQLFQLITINWINYFSPNLVTFSGFVIPYFALYLKKVIRLLLVTYWDRLSWTSVPCPDRCSSCRLWAGVEVGRAGCSGSDTVLSTPPPERFQPDAVIYRFYMLTAETQLAKPTYPTCRRRTDLPVRTGRHSPAGQAPRTPASSGSAAEPGRSAGDPTGKRTLRSCWS